MVRILVNGETLDLAADFAIDINDSSPVFNDRGSQSVPVTVPATRKNRRLLRFADRVDNAGDVAGDINVTLQSASYVRAGKLNIVEASRSAGVSLNIGFDNSIAYQKWATAKLCELRSMPVYTSGYGSTPQGLLKDLFTKYTSADPSGTPFAVFPIAVARNTESVDGTDRTIWELLNVPEGSAFRQRDTVKRFVNGAVTDVKVPAGYGVTPFVRVWRVLEIIFDDLRVKIEDNPFKNDPELAMLVVLNNNADACCGGTLRYAELMPDCTVEEFLNALWVRFGLVYDIDADAATVRLRFIRDIIADGQPVTLPGTQTDYETVSYLSPRYIKMSAGTSLEEAAPAQERFEDFSRGLDLSRLSMGLDVTSWAHEVYEDGHTEWDGDIRDDWWDSFDPEEPDPEAPEPEEPDPDDDYDPDYPGDDRDDWDYDPYSLPARAADKSTSAASSLAREFITGKWYKLDNVNGTVLESGSGFFSWDPATPGLEALELKSVDECVPVARVPSVNDNFNDFCPLYLCGSRHYSTYIAGGENQGDDSSSTPLSFLFAYTVDRKTVGRINGEGADGRRLTTDIGVKPQLSLLFQFSDGLFAKFWSAYDEMLRHSCRSVTVPVRVAVSEVKSLDMLRPVLFKGVPCALDTADYSIGPSSHTLADIRLRVLSPQGSYDIAAEQGIPDFAAALRHLEWYRLRENLAEKAHDPALRAVAAQTYKTNTGYEPHGTQGDSYDVTADGAILSTYYRRQPTWETDTQLPEPLAHALTITRTYKAYARFDIYEVHDMQADPRDPVDIELSETPIGTATVEVEYTVTLRSKWVNG